MNDSPIRSRLYNSLLAFYHHDRARGKLVWVYSGIHTMSRYQGTKSKLLNSDIISLVQVLGFGPRLGATFETSMQKVNETDKV
jgi:hypothetical protein